MLQGLYKHTLELTADIIIITMITQMLKNMQKILSYILSIQIYFKKVKDQLTTTDLLKVINVVTDSVTLLKTSIKCTLISVTVNKT